MGSGGGIRAEAQRATGIATAFARQAIAGSLRNA